VVDVVLITVDTYLFFISTLSDNAYRNLYAQRCCEDVVNKFLIFKCGVLSYIELRLINAKCSTLLCIKCVINRLFSSVFGHVLYRYSDVANYNFVRD
jgi:hypothetical protein